MGHKGRPPKPGPRYPGGKLKRETHEEPVVTPLAPAQEGRIRSWAARFSADPTLGSELGMLMRAGQFTQAQYASGLRVGDVYRRYHRYKQLKDHVKSPSYEAGFTGSTDVAEERMSDAQLERFEAAIAAAERSWRQIDEGLAEVPRNVRQGVLELCVEDKVVNSRLYPAIRAFLDIMTRVFADRLGKSAKDTVRRLRVARSGGPSSPAQEQVAAAAAAVPTRRPDFSLAALRMVVRKLRPDLSDEGLSEVTTVFVAVRDRERFNAQKTAR